MAEIHPQYIKDAKGKKMMVVISFQEFEAIMEDLDELTDIRLYDKAKKDDDGTRIAFSEYLANRNRTNG